MNERIVEQHTNERQITQIYNRVTRLTKKGEPYEKTGKKFSVVLSEGIDGLPACPTVTLFSGHVQDEAKIIYEDGKMDGPSERIELTFRNNGEFHERVLRSNPFRGDFSLEEVYRDDVASFIGLKVIETLLSRVEAKLEHPEAVKPCSDIPRRSKHSHRVGFGKHTSPIHKLE
jgi:hypothetical protein